jgi:hypothetical protein
MASVINAEVPSLRGGCEHMALNVRLSYSFLLQLSSLCILAFLDRESLEAPALTH